MIRITNAEHVFICGITGSGKTTLMKRLYGYLAPGHTVVIDPKNELALPNGRPAYKLETIPEILAAGDNAVFKHYPQAAVMDKLARWVYRKGNLTMIVDESALILPEGQLTDGWVQLITGGRSRKATVWALCQRPALIDKTVISQCDHYFVFRLILKHDKRPLMENIPLSREDFNRLQNYQFFHYSGKAGGKPTLH